MVAGFFRELKQQIVILNQVVRTREIWVYFSVCGHLGRRKAHVQGARTATL